MSERTMPTERGVGFLLNHASRVVTSQLRDKLRQLGLDEDMWTMLQNIHSTGETGATPEETAEKLRMPPGALIDAADRLVRDGWAAPVSRPGADPERLVLTEKTRQVLPALRSEAHMLLEHATAGFSNAELEKLAEYLKRIIDNMA